MCIRDSNEDSSIAAVGDCILVAIEVQDALGSSLLTALGLFGIAIVDENDNRPLFEPELSVLNIVVPENNATHELDCPDELVNLQATDLELGAIVWCLTWLLRAMEVICSMCLILYIHVLTILLKWTERTQASLTHSSL